MTGNRLGFFAVDAALVRRVGAAAPSSWQIEVCQDPVRFAADSAADQLHQRVLGVALDPEGSWAVLDAVRRWRASCPVMVLHDGGTMPRQLRAIAFGGIAVVSYEAAPGRIIRAAEAALDGDALIPLTTLNLFAARLRREPAETVSARERTWLVGLAEGLTVQALSQKSQYSERQMRRHLSALYSRMGVENRDQAVALASRLGVID